MNKLLPLLFTLLLTTTAFAQRNNCGVLTSTTSLNRYDIANRAPIVLCVNDSKFNRWDLAYMLEQGVRVKILMSDKVKLNRWDISALGNSGKVSLVINTKMSNVFNRWDLEGIIENNVRLKLRDNKGQFNRWDLESILEKGAIVTLKSSQTKLNRWDLASMGEAASKTKKSKLILILDDDRFNRWDIEAMAKSGVIIRYTPE